MHIHTHLYIHLPTNTIDMRTHTHLYIHMRTNTLTPAYTHAYIHTSAYNYTYTCIHIHIHIYVRIHMHAHAHTYICTYVRMPTHTHIYRYLVHIYIIHKPGQKNVKCLATPPSLPPPKRPTPEPRLAPPETGVSCTILRRADGGMESEVCGKRGRDIYFMGIIDILQASSCHGILL